jgi:putative membrane protein
VLIVRIAVNAVALLAAGLLVPDIQIAWSDEATGIGLTLLLLALVFGLVNASIGRIARVLSLPLNILTLGLFSVLLNAGLLLAVAAIVATAWEPLIVLGGFPPELGLPAVTAAVSGALVIGIVSTLLTVLIPQR